MAEPSVITVGHGTLDAGAFAALLHGAGVDLVVDVRRFPGSRRHPHVNKDRMAQWLPDRGLAYSHVAELGGRRQGAPDSPNVALRNDSFRAYGDHMATEEFARGISAVLAAAADGTPAIMCAESVWWRCHRRLVADHLVLVEGLTVAHLFHDSRLAVHEPTPEARCAEPDPRPHVVYDGGTLFAGG